MSPPSAAQLTAREARGSVAPSHSSAPRAPSVPRCPWAPEGASGWVQVRDVVPPTATAEQPGDSMSPASTLGPDPRLGRPSAGELAVLLRAALAAGLRPERIAEDLGVPVLGMEEAMADAFGRAYGLDGYSERCLRCPCLSRCRGRR